MRHGFRSDFELKLSAALSAAGSKAEYETLRVPYQKEPSTYTPDLLLPNGIIVEAKGRFLPSDRSKHLLIREQHPGLDIRFVFYRANERLSARSNTSYAQWCEKHGFLWADKAVPAAWLTEPDKEVSNEYRKQQRRVAVRKKAKTK